MPASLKSSLQALLCERLLGIRQLRLARTLENLMPVGRSIRQSSQSRIADVVCNSAKTLHARELARVFGAALRVDLAPHSTLSESRDAQHVLGDHAGIVVRLGIFPAS